jgi:hypothetical protein
LDLDADVEKLFRNAHLPDAMALGECLNQQAIRRPWPAAMPRDLDDMNPNRRALAKVCEACLAKDAAAGRDHYIRQEWRFSWRVSCRYHLAPLIDVEVAEFVPLKISGIGERRVRLLRGYELTVDRMLTREDRGRAGSKVILPAPLLCLETDVLACLAGSGLPSIWCCGHEWNYAREAMHDLADILLTREKGAASARLIHRVLMCERMPTPQGGEFSSGSLNVLSAAWQRHVVSALAALLLDPERYSHVQNHHRLNVHDQLVYGIAGSRRVNGPLGRIAISDLFCSVLSGANREVLEKIEGQLGLWPHHLRHRIRSAAAASLHIS